MQCNKRNSHITKPRIMYLYFLKGCFTVNCYSGKDLVGYFPSNIKCFKVSVYIVSQEQYHHTNFYFQSSCKNLELVWWALQLTLEF